MRTLGRALPLAAATFFAAAPAFAEDASDTIAHQIGQLVIQNANLAAQVQRLSKELEEAKNAKQVPSAGAANGGSGAQPKVRQEGGRKVYYK